MQSEGWGAQNQKLLVVLFMSFLESLVPEKVTHRSEFGMKHGRRFPHEY